VGAYPPGDVLSDTWTLSLNGTPTWIQLEASGESPGQRQREVGIYDPLGQRLIVYGGSGSDDVDPVGPGDLHALSLDGTPEWTKIRAQGTGPSHAWVASASYDSVAQRMIVFDGQQGFALELSSEPTWHHFCDGELRFPSSYDSLVTPFASEPVLVADGVFLSVGDGAYRFSLNTPYCD